MLRVTLGFAITLAIVILLAYSPERVGPVLLVGLPLVALLNYFPARAVGKKVAEEARFLRGLPCEALPEMHGEEYIPVGVRQAHIAVMVEHESPDALRVVVRGTLRSGFPLVQHALTWPYPRADGLRRIGRPPNNRMQELTRPAPRQLCGGPRS